MIGCRRSPGAPSTLLLATALCAVVAFVALGQAPPAAAEPPPAAADLPVAVRDQAGAVVGDLAAADLVVLEAGEARPVLDLTPESRPWRLVLYFDAELAARPTLPRAAEALEALAGRLVALGEVEVLLAGDTLRRVLPPTRDPATLAAALARLAVLERGGDRLVELRRRGAEEVEGLDGETADGGAVDDGAADDGAVESAAADDGAVESAAADDGAAEGRAVADAAAESAAVAGAAREDAQIELLEVATVRRRLDLLLERLAEPWPGDADGPAALFWVGDGYDLDPGAWRRPEGSPAVTGAASVALVAATAATARAAAALGWTVVPVALRGEQGDDPSRWGSATMETPAGETKILSSVWLPRRRTPAEREADEIAAAAPPPPVPVAPAAPLATFAAASGGELVVAAAGIAGAVDRLASRLRLRYLPAPGEPGEPQPLAVEAAAVDDDGDGADGADDADADADAVGAAGPRLDVVARRWTASPAPPALAALRARHLLDGVLDPGAVEVRAAVAVTGRGGFGEAALEIEIDPPLPGAELRLTLATVGEDGEAWVTHRRLPAGGPAAAAALPPPSVSGRWPPPGSPDPAAEAEAGDDAGRLGAGGARPPSTAWSWRGTVELPRAADRVAVVVEDPLSAAWGGTLAGVVDLSLEVGGRWDAAAGVLPGAGAVRLLRPEGAMLAGPVRFETIVSPAVARVELWLDGRRAAAVAAAPFAAVLELGRLPLPRRVEAIAFDAAGAELGRDETVVNAGASSLRVRIVEPASGRAVGPVTVEIEVAVPEGRRLDRVELFWQERRIATLHQAPFRHRLTVSPQSPEGPLRAVAWLVDGGEAEDAVYLNGAVPSERLDVALTELYVVVTGDDGRPVRGLASGDFVVREDGRQQEIATFGDASELPITLGLALDTSASMFVKLPVVREAALAVLDDLVPGRDQAVLVDFGSQVRLTAGPTRDFDRLRSAARSLEPRGRTSLWEAVVFSLVQLQGAPGRRALLVYSDGADEDGDVSYRTALAFARRAGVPVYAIVANNEAVRRGGLDLGLLPSLGGRIERLTRATGGRAWVVRRGEDLAPYYAEIRAELAAQYRLGYYPPAGDDGGWRRVTVDVGRRGASARTVSGYRR